jgi:Type II secretion system (T2SS), protein E, N-terminal domain
MAKLGQLLVARGWITVQQLTRALKNQNVAGGRLGTCLLEMDALSEELLLKGLSEQLGVPAAGADELRGVPDEVLALVPEKLARRLRAVPFRVEGGRLDLALMDPRNLSAQDEIAFASGKRVKVFVAGEIRILEALEKYYQEECPSRFGLVLDRLNRARFLWEKPAEKALPHSGEELLAPIDSPFAPPPKLDLPPDLPPPPVPRPVPPVDPDLFSAARLFPPKPAPAAAPAPPPAAPAPAPAPAMAARVAPSKAVTVPTPQVAAAAAPAVSPEPLAPQPAPPPPTPMRSQIVSLTPEERAELGTFAYVEPAGIDRSLPAPTTLDEAEEELAKASDLEEVARLVLGFLGRDHRRAALFQVGRDRVTGWRIHGTGIDREAFAAFSTGFDQPSLFLNLRHSNGIYLGPLPPMPAHRQLARTWGGDLPRDCVMLPVRIKDRLVLVIYADGATRGPIDLSQMQRLTAATTGAVERCILQKKAKAQ